jgi:hypothetical protein
MSGLARAEWLDARRIRRWSGMFLAVHLICGALIVAGSHGWLVNLHGRSGTTDFVSFFAAGKVAAGPGGAAVYDRAVHYAAERAATSAGIPYVYFFYPPVYLLICRALAVFPYLVAFAVFEAVTLAAYLAVMRAVLRRPGPDWYLPMLGFAPVLWTIGFGQNALLTAALFGGGCLLLAHHKHFTGGFVLGLLFYKPHTGLLIPIALLAARDWRAIAGATASVVGSIAASVALFGWGAWPEFLGALARSQHEFAQGAIARFAFMVNLSGTLRDHGVSAHAAVLSQTAAQVILAIIVGWCWQHRQSSPWSRAAVLIGAAVPMMPVVLFYDLTLLSVAAAFIVADAQASRFLPYEKAALAAAWLAGGLCYPLARAWHLPLGLACCLLVLGVGLRRHAHFHYINNSQPTLSPAALRGAQRWLVAPQNEASISSQPVCRE